MKIIEAVWRQFTSPFIFNHSWKTIFPTMVSALICLPIADVSAQSGSDNSGASEAQLEEIIVTASKRGQQVLQDIPLTIQAFSADTLEDMGVRDFEDYAMFVAGMSFESQGPGDKEIVIRGVNSSGNATTALYYDEAVLTSENTGDGSGRNADIKLYDIERIEILKGPQGTLYGAGSMSGTMRIITKKPDLESYSGSLELGAGTTRKSDGENFELAGMFNIPFIEGQLGLRAVGWVVDNDGFIDNTRIFGPGDGGDFGGVPPAGGTDPLPTGFDGQRVGGDDINDESVVGGRVQLRYAPTDQLTITAGATLQVLESDGSPRYSPASSNATFGGDLDNVDYNVNPLKDEIDVYSLTLEYDAGYGNYLATTNKYKRNVDYSFDSSPILFFFGVPFTGIPEFGIPTGLASTLMHIPREIWSNEIRFNSNFDGPWQILLGGFYSETEDGRNVVVVSIDPTGRPIGDGFGVRPGGGGPVPDIFGQFREGQIDQFAFFGEAYYSFTEDVTLTLGGRYFDSSQDQFSITTFPFGGFGPDSVPDDRTQSLSETKFTPKIGIAWQISEDRLLFANAANGFREGGVNGASIPQFAEIPESFESDELWNYEIGAKTSWLDNSVRVNATAFLIRWKDMQVSNFDPTGAFQFKQNAGKSSIDGVELEVAAAPAPGWDLSATATYMNARLTDDQPPSDFDPNTGVNGDSIDHVPDWTASASGQYTWPLFSNYEGRVRADWAYRGSTATKLNRRSPFWQSLDSYSVASIRAAIEGENWSATLYVDNLFDERAEIDKIFSVQELPAIFTIRPRTIGINLTYQYSGQ